jgi:hypothetical protein
VCATALKAGSLSDLTTATLLFGCVAQAAQHMTRLTSLQLQDLLPDR